MTNLDPNDRAWSQFDEDEYEAWDDEEEYPR